MAKSERYKDALHILLRRAPLVLDLASNIPGNFYMQRVAPLGPSSSMDVSSRHQESVGNFATCASGCPTSTRDRQRDKIEVFRLAVPSVFGWLGVALCTWSVVIHQLLLVVDSSVIYQVPLPSTHSNGLDEPQVVSILVGFAVFVDD